ncbi:MAG TPA: PfkB family carbohydrate kinase [Syntrophorhabdaceae bacterium]|nr:PfkB family carbohydrate kinase [Syntrophorhabdaceae bacterium]
MLAKGTAGIKRYDIVFVGHVAAGNILPYERSAFVLEGSPVLFSAIAASCINKRLAVITRLAAEEEHLLQPFKEAGIDVYAQLAPVTTWLDVVYPSANVDERQAVLMKSAGFFEIENIPSIEPCLIHLAGLTDQEFTIEFLKGLRELEFRLSLDMQSFVRQTDDKTGVIHFKDVPGKQEIMGMIDILKLDAVEANILTGTDDLEEAAATLESWGSPETVITRADGALARRKGKNYFERFSNRGNEGRTGRGDTTFGAYLARRIDHPVDESLRFAAALASIKMETPGPFRGSLDDVLERMVIDYNAQTPADGHES